MKSKSVFSINEESDSGGSSFCWVEKNESTYFLYGNELGKIAGPCESIISALNASGFQFGMDYCEIECVVTPEELGDILGSPSFLLRNFSRLTINGTEMNPADIREITEVYRIQMKAKS